MALKLIVNTNVLPSLHRASSRHSAPFSTLGGRSHGRMLYGGFLLILLAMALTTAASESAGEQCDWPSGSRQQTRASASSGNSMVDAVKQKNDEYPVIVYSKSYCPYCARVKSLFKQLDVKHQVIELDQTVEGNDVQAALAEITGRRTVPQVFVKGDFIGGCDDTMAAHSSGKLKEVFDKAGISASF